MTLPSARHRCTFPEKKGFTPVIPLHYIKAGYEIAELHAEPGPREQIHYLVNYPGPLYDTCNADLSVCIDSILYILLQILFYVSLLSRASIRHPPRRFVRVCIHYCSIIILHVTSDIISYIYVSLDSCETHDTDLCMLVYICTHTHHLPKLAKYHHMLS